MGGRLVLIRHAKSDYPWGVDDHDRPLNERGRRDAPQVGAWLDEHLTWGAAGAPAVRVSTARRAQLTWTLAGSRLTMDRVFANLVTMVGVTPVEAALMCATVQARAHGLADRGRIAEGLLADLVVLDGDWRVRQTLLGGAVVHARDAAQR